MGVLENTKLWREKILEKVNHNLALIPEELVERDYQTDSLLNKKLSFPEKRSLDLMPKAMAVEIQKAFEKLFGFPYVLPVSQGRVAEAMLCRLMVRNGHYIPGSALFPTTAIHQQLSGATPLEIMIPEAYDPASPHPFKGNLDIEALEHAIQTYYPRWIPYICVEPCNNAVGGQPISMENMRQVHAVAQNHKIPVYLDACRLIENAFLIQEREAGYKNKSIADILLEFCSYADGCTLSATKDFPTPVGGFFATRDENLYQRAFDFMIGFGSGLCYENKKKILQALSEPKQIFDGVKAKLALVQQFHKLMAGHKALVQSVGANGIFLHVPMLELDIPVNYHPEKSLLYFLYKEYGLRGAENPQSARQKELGLHYLRFAVPLLGETEASVRAAAGDLLKGLKEKSKSEGLEKTHEPAGMTGSFRAAYRPMSLVKMEKG
jgi:tyrosine phenol-lyase